VLYIALQVKVGQNTQTFSLVDLVGLLLQHFSR
jgi:hypothetical protein